MGLSQDSCLLHRVSGAASGIAEDNIHLAMRGSTTASQNPRSAGLTCIFADRTPKCTSLSGLSALYAQGQSLRNKHSAKPLKGDCTLTWLSKADAFWACTEDAPDLHRCVGARGRTSLSLRKTSGRHSSCRHQCSVRHPLCRHLYILDARLGPRLFGPVRPGMLPSALPSLSKCPQTENHTE